MNKQNKPQSLSEEQIDEIVIAQAEDDAAWEEPIAVHRSAVLTVALPPELAARATFFARLHNAISYGGLAQEYYQGKT